MYLCNSTHTSTYNRARLVGVIHGNTRETDQVTTLKNWTTRKLLLENKIAGVMFVLIERVL